MFAEMEPMHLFASLKSITYRLWDEQSSKLVSFAHLKRLKKRTAEAEYRKRDGGNAESQASDRHNDTH